MDGPSLRCGRLALTLAPAVGGSIARFDWMDGGRRVPILRGAGQTDGSVLEMASFPLVPYVNRIRGGAFGFHGRDIRLSPNMAGDISPLHGQGWLASWSVRDSSERSASLRFTHEVGEWPWRYEAGQRLDLDEGGLSVTLTCRNLSNDAMPCGLGQHPYFPCGPATVIDTGVTHAWTVDANVLPVEKVAADGRFDLRNRPVCGQNLDHGFGGWTGVAQMTDPEWPYSIIMSSPNAHFFQLYSPGQGGLFVAEPVTHANAALNEPEERWPELGLRVLEPGEEMQLDMRLGVRPG